MLTEVLSVGEIKEAIKESISNFEPLMGDNVKKDNKKNNDKTYNDIKKDVKTTEKFPGVKETDKDDRSTDHNNSILDYNPNNEVSDDYKKRIKAQSKGYVSVEDEKRGSKDKNAYFDDNAKTYKAMSDKSKQRNKLKTDIEHSGIVSQNLEKKEKNSMFENKEHKTKRLIFKKTYFVNESQMLSLIPEQYKVDGQKIYMKDRKGDEYIVECNYSNLTNNVEVNILNFNNEQVLNEQLKRMQDLFEYDSSNPYGKMNNKMRSEENNYFKNNLDLARNLNK